MRPVSKPNLSSGEAAVQHHVPITFDGVVTPDIRRVPGPRRAGERCVNFSGR
jgi:hypothetical protein